MRHSLSAFGYQSQDITLSEQLRRLNLWQLSSTPEEDRYETYMDAGNDLRRRIKRGDAPAILAVMSIREQRARITGNERIAAPCCAYILRQLKRREEVATLRHIYGDAFLLVAAYSPENERMRKLAADIAASHHRTSDERAYYGTAIALIQRDDAEADDKFGQNVWT